ncbi:MAG TPA: SGNH/GDSL hydrolase family protein [Acidobacteriaceae bacterium]|jgi:lysophospholipase L1-like esterase|nr:SGNH/GDSL hydrolase family protein [Acidobacteriaceae bacterium]
MIHDAALPNGVTKVTLRQRIRVSIGGPVVRLRFSNVHGTQPLVLSDVRIAQAASDHDAVVGTDHAVMFDGASTVTIAAGATTTSDPIVFEVKPSSDVMVSIYLPQPVDADHMSGHTQAWQNVYLAQGDVSASATVTPIALSHALTSFYYLTNLDVQNAQAVGAVATFGASITDSSNSTFGASQGWRDLLAVRLNDADMQVGVVNAALSGNSLLRASVFSGATGVSRFVQDALDQPNVKWVIFSDDPINDLSGLHPPSYDELIAAIKQVRDTAHGRGIKFYCSMLTPNIGRAADAWTPEAEVTLEKINAWYRSADGGCDGIVDQDAAVHDPARPTRYLPAYDAGDHLHPNDAGHRAIADSIDLKLFTLMSKTTNNR